MKLSLWLLYLIEGPQKWPKVVLPDRPKVGSAAKENPREKMKRSSATRLPTTGLCCSTSYSNMVEQKLCDEYVTSTVMSK